MSRFKQYTYPAVFVFLFTFALTCSAESKVRTVVTFFSWNVSLPAFHNPEAVSILAKYCGAPILHFGEIKPSNSTFYQPSFINHYKGFMVAVSILLISQTLLILYLVKLNSRQKKIARQKEETERIYREVVREDRLLKMFELTASLSHELNQPLTAILYNAQAGKRFLQSGKVDIKQTEEIFDYIIEDDKRAGGIISSVRSLMKLEDREKENVSLRVLVQETLDIFHSEAIRNNVRVETSCCPDPVWVYGDKIQLQQVLLNFMRNAINAMDGIPARQPFNGCYFECGQRFGNNFRS